MNRKEFLNELSKLLEGIPEEDKIDALNYYNDYFDDAGSENEQNVIEELESPERVAMKIKAERGDVELRESGKEDKDKEENVYYDNETYTYDDSGVKEADQPWTSKTLKYILIGAIILIGCPVIIPIAVALLVTVVAVVAAIFISFVAIVIVCVCIVIAGVVLFLKGAISLIGSGASAGLAVIGIGLMAVAIGMIGTVIGIRLCTIVFPGVIRGIVYICRKPFHRKKEE